MRPGRLFLMLMARGCTFSCNSKKEKKKKNPEISVSTITNFHCEFVRGLQNKAIVHIYLIKTS